MKWLMQKIGFKAIDWVKDEAHKWADPPTKGLMMMQSSSFNTQRDHEYDHEDAGNSSEDADIEKNPGPTFDDATSEDEPE